MRETTRTWFGFITALTLVTVPLQNGVAAPKAVQNDKQLSPPRWVTKTASIEILYQHWEQRYIKAGGDRNVMIGLGPMRGLTPPSPAGGFVLLNLITGDVTVYVKGLAEASDLWLVDNQPGPGKSFLPEEGDKIVHIGLLEPKGNAVAMLATSLGRGFFEKFDLDLVTVTSAGASPTKDWVLLGTRSTFERRYTRERLGRAGPKTPAGRVPPDPSPSQVLVSHGLVSRDVFDGGELFFRETFTGNGRTCATCHPVENNLVVDPAFIDTLPNDHPIFVAEEGHPNRVPNLEIPELLREFGLILENVDGFEDPVRKFTMRGVPHSLSLSTSIMPPEPDADGNLPDGSTLAFEQRTGWSGDGAPMPGTLRLFSVGAVIQHFTKDLARTPGTHFHLPTDEELDEMEAFMLTTGRTDDLDLSSVTLADARAESGRDLFMGNEAKCSVCHNNAGANTSFAGDVNFNFDTGVEPVRIAVLNEMGIPFDGGFGGQNQEEFTFDSSGDGIPDSFGNGTFNTPPLVEAADTGPFFHTNAFKTIEDAVAFYSSDAFNTSPAGIVAGGINLTDEQTEDVAAFLRIINAAFNYAIAIQRTEAALRLLDPASGSPGNRVPGNSVNAQRPGPAIRGPVNAGRSLVSTINRLLELANAELKDAIEVLQGGPFILNDGSIQSAMEAMVLNEKAINAKSNSTQRELVTNSLAKQMTAKEELGTGLDFVMGEGNLLF